MTGGAERGAVTDDGKDLDCGAEPDAGMEVRTSSRVGYQPGLAVAGQGGPLSVDLTQLSG